MAKSLPLEIPGHLDCILPGGDAVVVCQLGAVKLWNVLSHSWITSFVAHPEEAPIFDQFLVDADAIAADDGKTLVTLGADEKIKILDIEGITAATFARCLFQIAAMLVADGLSQPLPGFGGNRGGLLAGNRFMPLGGQLLAFRVNPPHVIRKSAAKLAQHHVRPQVGALPPGKPSFEGLGK